MKDTSGATVMDPATQVTSLHGVSMLDAAREPFESNLCLAVLRERNGPNDNALANVAIAAHVNLHGDPMLAAADAAREAGNAPNSVLAAAASILGPRRVAGAQRRYRDAARPVPGQDPGRQRRGEPLDRHRARARPCLALRPMRGPQPCSQRSTHAAPSRCSCAICAASARRSQPTRCLARSR